MGRIRFKDLEIGRWFKVRDETIMKVPAFYMDSTEYNCIDDNGYLSWCADNFEVTLADRTALTSSKERTI